jgi:hypothetical protein
MYRIAVCLLAWPTLSAAAPRSGRLTMHVTEGTNLHLANREGAINWQTHITITVDLAADGKVAARSTGSQAELNSYGGPRSRSTHDTTTWTTRWSGTYEQSDDRLRLDLVLVDHACKHEVSTTEFDAAQNAQVTYAPEKIACKTAARQSQLTCTSEEIEISDRAEDATRHRGAVWRCNAMTPDDLAESPAEWVLGKTMCIDRIAGRTPNSIGYVRC